MKPIRVLVVEDSLTARRHLCDALSADPGMKVVGEAEDGRRAIELCRELKPDVVTMDMMLPVMSGLAATEYIMAFSPTPILVVSSSLNRGELFRTYDALAAGAVDVMEKPSGVEPNGEWERRFVQAVSMVSRIRVITHPHGRLAAFARRRASPTPPEVERGRFRVLAIGASTGGPGAVVEILKALPAPYPLPVLLVIHIGEPFGAAFSEWLDGQTRHRVSLARDGEPVAAAGRIVLAPPGYHLVAREGRLRLTTDPERHSCRPSVDVLFESLAAEFGSSCVACLLTGMGRDGALGMLAVRRAGGLTLAQDEATSVVYGMPAEAAALGAACHVLPLGDIGSALADLAATPVVERPR
ncbi:MAG TPA: chemotaxis-specific protein-glutamate methyltransferase CheB [Candidatus Eisenbacteria bacterium]